MFIVKYNTEKYIEHISSLTSYYKANISGTIIQVKKLESCQHLRCILYTLFQLLLSLGLTIILIFMVFILLFFTVLSPNVQL